MAKKTTKKTRTARRRVKKTKTSFLWPLFVLLIVAATIGGTGYFIFLSPGTGKLGAPSKRLPPPSQPAYQAGNEPPVVYEEDSLPELKKETVKKTVPVSHKPRLALLIDDMGYKQKLGQQLIELDLNLSFAILPFTPHGHSLMEMAHAKKKEVILHLPMEATAAKWNPGPGALYTSMSARSIKAQVRKDLEDIPFAAGVNNHMGSKFTSNSESMRAVLETLKARNLFFLDSITIGSSVAHKEAKAMQIKSGRRDVFIDNEQDSTKIKAQLERLVTIAKKHGSAIGVGHPYPATVATLSKEAGWLRDQVELVTVSALME